MESARATTDRISAGRLSSRIALLMLCVVLGTCLGLFGLARSQTVKNWIRQGTFEEARWKKQIPLFSFTSHFLDVADRLCHEEIPSADFSRGGVYLAGASNMTMAFRTWELPAEARSLFHNFAIGGTNHADEFDLFRFLVEQQGLLAAGGEKTLVIFGLSYHRTHNARLAGDGPGEYFTRLWTRHGFYTVLPDGTIRPRELSAPARIFLLERTRITGLLKELVNLAYTPLKSPRVSEGTRYSQEWTRVMAANWKEKIQAETAAFARLVAYLQSRRVKIVVVRMPEGSWESNTPFESAYIHEISKICDQAGVLILDFSRLLDDEGFADSIHLNPSGIEKFERTVLGIGLDHLRGTGALPERRVETRP